MAGTARSSAAQIAADEFGDEIDGAKIEIISADHQNKPDIGAAIASRWFDVDHVDAITDLVNSGVAGAVLNVAKKDNKLLLLTGAGSETFTGKNCAPDNLVQWVYDTYAAGSAAGEAMPYLGKTWFFITADYVFGKGVQAGTTRAVEARGGKVVGSVLHPIGTSGFLLLHSAGPSVGCRGDRARQWRPGHDERDQGGEGIRRQSQDCFPAST